MGRLISQIKNNAVGKLTIINRTLLFDAWHILPKRVGINWQIAAEVVIAESSHLVYRKMWHDSVIPFEIFLNSLYPKIGKYIFGKTTNILPLLSLKSYFQSIDLFSMIPVLVQHFLHQYSSMYIEHNFILQGAIQLIK